MVVGIVLGVLMVSPLVLTYLFFIRWVDRFEPEPWWLIACAFLWGAIFATLGGGIGSSYAEGMTGRFFHFAPSAIDIVGATVFAPIFEETFKAVGVGLIALVSALGLRELDGPLDGAIYGGVVGLGFTLTEDILYVSTQYQRGGLISSIFIFVLRTGLLGLSHCTFTACTGLGFGIATQTRRLSLKILAPVLGFLAAIVIHAMHNVLPSVFGNGGLLVMLVISWMINVLFFVLLSLLVIRDRTIVIRELFGEVGQLLHPRELMLVSSYFALGMRNWAVLLSSGWAAFRSRRTKQLQLVELAFIKSRRRRGETGTHLERKEAELRLRIAEANQRGVWLGG